MLEAILGRYYYITIFLVIFLNAFFNISVCILIQNFNEIYLQSYIMWHVRKCYGNGFALNRQATFNFMYST